MTKVMHSTRWPVMIGDRTVPFCARRMVFCSFIWFDLVFVSGCNGVSQTQNVPTRSSACCLNLWCNFELYVNLNSQQLAHKPTYCIKQSPFKCEVLALKLSWKNSSLIQEICTKCFVIPTPSSVAALEINENLNALVVQLFLKAPFYCAISLHAQRGCLKQFRKTSSSLVWELCNNL